MGSRRSVLQVRGGGVWGLAMGRGEENRSRHRAERGERGGLRVMERPRSGVMRRVGALGKGVQERGTRERKVGMEQREGGGRGGGRDEGSPVGRGRRT